MPVTPVVAEGSPVAFVSVADVGVPSTGVTSVGEVERTFLPDPVDDVTPVPPCATAIVVNPVVKEPDAKAPTLVSEEVTTPEANVVPVMPEAGAEVAAIVPPPDTAREAPDPTTIAAVVLVEPVSAN